MAEAPVVFGNSVEALVRVLGDALTPDVRARYSALGIDLDKPHPAYPYEVWIEALKLAMHVRWPNLGADEATYLLGRAIFESYGQTVMGSALLKLIKVLGPRRALERMARNLRTTNNYSETKLTPRGERAFELWVNRVAFPQYFRGLLEAGLEFGGARSPTVEFRPSDREGVVFWIAWE